MSDPRASLAACAGAACLLTLLASVSSAGLLAQGAKLCVHPVQAPLPEEDERRSDLERRLGAPLAAASFRLAEPDAVRELEERIRRESGGFVDPATGERDARRYRAYQDRLASALGAELGCDAQLQVSVVSLRANFVNGTASWDGASQRVSSTGRIVLNALAGVTESGWVSALSLWLHVTDLEGNDLAFRSAGIETPVSFAVMEDQDLVPEDLWLTDGARLDAAIGSALGPLGASLRELGAP
jgi:hypothetical protein